MSHLPCQTGHTFPDEHRTGCAYYKQQNTKRSCPKLQGTECRSGAQRQLHLTCTPKKHAHPTSRGKRRSPHPISTESHARCPSAITHTHTQHTHTHTHTHTHLSERRHCHDALVRGGRILDGLDHQWQHIRHIGLEAAAAHDCQLANGGQHGACHPHFCACAGRVVDTRRCKRWGVQLCWCCIWLPAGRRWPARCAPPPLLCLHRQGWWTQGSVGDGLFSSAGVGASYHGRWRPAWCAPPTLLKQGRRSQKAGDVLLSSGGGRYYQLTAASMENETAANGGLCGAPPCKRDAVGLLQKTPSDTIRMLGGTTGTALRRRHQLQPECLVGQQGQLCSSVWKKLKKQPVVKVCTAQSCMHDAAVLPQKTPSATITMLGETTGTVLRRCLEEA
eukprot:1162062-Pelagomonas_calceolata.AAC.34